MFGKTLPALLLCLLSFSGCLGFGGDGDDHKDDCDEHEGEAHDECHQTGTGTGTQTGGPGPGGNETPNVPPVAVLTMTDAEGNALNESSAILVGQNITFSATGTGDSDGSLDLVALSVNDKDGTRTIPMLENGQLIDVTLTFNATGFMLASLRALDEDGAAASAFGLTWVNAPQTLTGDFRLGVPDGVHADDCEGPTASAGQGTIADDPYSKASTFQTYNGTAWISAKVISGTVSIAICGPDGTALSPAGTDVATEQATFEAGVGHYVFVVSEAPNQSFEVEVIPHWEPKPAA